MSKFHTLTSRAVEMLSSCVFFFLFLLILFTNDIGCCWQQRRHINAYVVSKLSKQLHKTTHDIRSVREASFQQLAGGVGRPLTTRDRQPRRAGRAPCDWPRDTGSPREAG